MRILASNKIRLSVLLLGTVAAGCVSLSAQIPTHPSAGRSAAQVAQDEAQCETYGKSQASHHGDHYQACMITKGYATNWDMDQLGWIIGVAQTRPHETAATVMTDLAACDRQADNAKSSTDVPALTPEQATVIAGQAQGRGFEGWHRRPVATRMLVFCLQERGYAVTPWVPMSGPR